MFATLFSIVLSLFILYTSFSLGDISVFHWLWFVGAAFVLFFIYALSLIFSWSPIQKVQQNLTPRILDVFNKDKKIRLAGIYLSLLILFFLYMAINDSLVKVLGERINTAISFILLGIGIDFTLLVLSRMTHYINPFNIASECTHQAIKSAMSGDDQELTQWIEAVAEVGINSAGRSLPSLCNQAVTDLQLITKEYLSASKSFAHRVEKKAEGESDPVSFTLFFIFQRIEIIFSKALEMGLEPIISTVISSLGKITIDSAKYDMSLSTYPIHYLGTLALKAQKKGMDEIGDKALVTYIEVAKIILRDLDVTYLELQEPFFTMIGKMEEISKEIFKMNKEINIGILIAPFKQLKSLFEGEKLINQQDSQLIINDLNRVINEYEQLQIVLKTLPPISSLTTEKSSEKTTP